MKLFLFLVFLVVLGGILRISNLANNPPSLNVDEVSVGYNAYSILKTGRDEYGFFLPISFKSLGDYKPPVYIYLTSLSIAIFGLNEMAIRFPAAFLSTLTIPFIFLLTKKLTQQTSYAAIAAVLFTISPWEIYHARFALETPLATTFVVIGVYSFLKMLEGDRLRWPIISALSFGLSIFTYQTERLFTPLLILVLFILNKKKFLQKKNLNNLIFCFVLSFFFLVFLYSLFLNSGATRAQMLFLGKDPEFQREVGVLPVSQFIGMPQIIEKSIDGNLPLLAFYWVNKTFLYLSPGFLFFNGLQMTAQNTYGVGLLYIFEIPLFLYGIYWCFKNRVDNIYLYLLWIIIGILPASFTLGDPSSRRILIISPIILIICSIGSIELFNLTKKVLTRKTFIVLYSMFLVLVVWNLSYTYLIFSVHFPIEKAEDFMGGSKEAALFIQKNQDKYREIVVDPNMGVDGPYLVNVPYLYILFYSQFDPSLYQAETKKATDNSYGFGKYTFRHIDWQKDQFLKNTLLVGSIWSLPPSDMPPSLVMDRIYLPNGRLALMAVTSEK